MREQFANNASSVLAAGITNVATSLTVSSASSFPTTGNFRILVNQELMLVTAVSGTTFTVTRGIEGTTAVSHNIGDNVTHILTAGGLLRFGRDNIPLLGIRPELTLTDAAGNTLTSADFTWVNQGASTVTDNADGSITLTAPTINSTNLRLLAKSQPSTPYEILVGFLPSYAGGFSTMKFGFRESATNKLVNMFINNSSSAGHIARGQRFNSATSAVGDQGSALYGNGIFNPVWAKIENDGVNLTFFISGDGLNFSEVYTEAVGAFFTTAPDQVFWGIEMFTTSTSFGSLTLVHWSES